MSSCYWIFKFIFYVFFKLFNRLEVSGEDRIPKQGGVIIVANHMSYLDPLALGATMKRRATYMARQGLFKIPLLRTFVSAFSFPVRRGSPRPSTIKEAVRRLKKGELIVMFPQGGRSLKEDLSDIKRGIGVIARLSRAVIVPALLEGTGRALPVGSCLLRPARITVKFAEPIKAEGRADEEITEMAAEAMRGLKVKT